MGTWDWDREPETAVCLVVAGLKSPELASCQELQAGPLQPASLGQPDAETPAPRLGLGCSCPSQLSSWALQESSPGIPLSTPGQVWEPSPASEATRQVTAGQPREGKGVWQMPDGVTRGGQAGTKSVQLRPARPSSPT